ncbi:hypothetical protein TSUD_126130 [Trifolium subterraneum]|uniref:Uncharacterized protein n=1 Tax=Trifolium subterraneum TaxID=3900 RepID=A0A2Z6NDZ1_TRISU|nr:hypothetical protein TSUD_126130 [Trifolium subterraneum]
MGEEGGKKINLSTSIKDLPVSAKKLVMPSKPVSFMAPSKLIRSANSPFQVWKNPKDKKSQGDRVDKGHNNQLLEHQLCIPNTFYTKATNNNINIMGKPNPDEAEKIVINDSLLTPDVGSEDSIIPLKPFSFVAPSKLVRSASSSFQVWKKPNDKKSHAYHDDQGNKNQQLEHQLGIPNSYYAQATNNKINILWKPIPYKAEKTVINDSLLTPDVGVEKSIMPFYPFSFMAPSKLVRSACSSFQPWKNPNDKKSHDDQGNNYQQMEHQLVRSTCSSFQPWKNPNDKKSHAYDLDQGNNNQQLEDQLGIPNTYYAQATNNKINFLWKPNPYKAEKTIINDSILTPNVVVEKSIMPFKHFSFMAPCKLVRSPSSSFQVWKKPNEKKSHDYDLDQGNNNQQLEHQLGISNTCYAHATNNKINILWKPNPYKAEKTIINDSILTPDVVVEKSIMPFKPFSFMAPCKLVRSPSSSFQVWKKPNEMKSRDDHVDQGNNNQQLEHQFNIPNIRCAQATNNKNKIAEKPDVDQSEKTIISDSLLTPNVGLLGFQFRHQQGKSKSAKAVGESSLFEEM